MNDRDPKAKPFQFCGAFGPIEAAAGVSVIAKQKEPGRWVNSRSCRHLTTKVYDGPEGRTIYPACDKGHIVERVAGSNLGRLFRGQYMHCPDYEEFAIIRPELVSREELEAYEFEPEEIDRICGPRLIKVVKS
jgi:hypothetical protein